MTNQNEHIESIIRAVAELPDRANIIGSPAAMLVTAEELAEILREHGAFLKDDQNDQKLDEPAQVGNIVFREGVAWKTVVNSAKRNYLNQQIKEKTKPILSPKQLISISLGESLIVPKEPSIFCLHSMAMRYRHDFGLLDTSTQECIVMQMRQLYEEATGQGFHKLDQEENKAIYDGLGASQSYLNRLKGMDKQVIQISHEDAERLKAEMTAVNEHDPMDCFAYAVYSESNTTQSTTLDEKTVIKDLDNESKSLVTRTLDISIDVIE